MRALQRVSCLLSGHQYWIGRESDRLFLRCTKCGHETAGVRLGHEAEDTNRGPVRRWLAHLRLTRHA